MKNQNSLYYPIKARASTFYSKSPKTIIDTLMKDQELIKDKKISFKIPNPGFIFHNKLPKSGSTTMHNILTVLSQWNNFEHIKIDSAMMKFEDEANLVG